jgi:hypothetical protein
MMFVFLLCPALAFAQERIETPSDVADLADAAAVADVAPSPVLESTPSSTRPLPPPLPDFEPISDRWRGIVPPPYELNVRGRLIDPYNQNRLKGDYPIWGQNTFLILTAATEYVFESLDTPTPSGVSSRRSGRFDFFGEGDKTVSSGSLKLTLELYRGQTAFRPRDWEIKAALVFNDHRLYTDENNAVSINPRKGDDRDDDHFAFQELSIEAHLLNLSDAYDFLSAKVGIQKFASDFRGFVFSDSNLGARLLGSAASNRYQYNLIFLPMLEKDTNSELNTVFDDRDQDVFIANLYRQDTFVPGYTTQFSFHYNHDKASVYADENGVPTRPALIGTVRPHDINAYYFGWAGDGHIGPLNLTHAFYQAWGKDGFNPLADRPIDFNAQMAAVEASIDVDWMRFRSGLFYASGDEKPNDGRGRGFDAIFDAPTFAGGPFSFWNSQTIRLQGVGLVQKQSLIPTLRSSKIEGQANFVHPGVFLVNAGYDADLTPTLKLLLNANALWFVETAPLSQFVNQPAIDHAIGIDYGIGLLYRPFLNNNVIMTAGASFLRPGAGFEDIYESDDTLHSVFTLVTLTY